ncbi:cysteine-rich KTR domain-containing protein [Clostridioides difficile]|uniref:cysteine-rich KTR domain-containing protein n=1 Tax=Clostridioides difficile TaxID=1496 RepID=UPI003F8D600D
MKIEWIHCLVCSNKTRLRIRLDIVLENFLLYYPKCKQETLINIKQLIFQLSKSRYTDTEPIIYENISRGYRLFIYLKLKLKQFAMQKVQKKQAKN